MPREILIPYLFCFRCGKQGMVYQTHESVRTPRGKLDMPHYRCHNCNQMWFEYHDTLAYVFASSSQQPLPTAAAPGTAEKA
jgi:hypothetical protein